MSISILPDPLSILDVRVIPFDSYAHACQCVREMVALKRKCFCVAVNPEKIYRAQKDPDLRRLLEQVDVGICDGIGVSIAARLLLGRAVRRCTGIDLFLELVGMAAENGLKVFLLGAKQESLDGACANLLQRYPSLRIAGRQNGYFQDARAVVERINASGPDLLFVAMGSPRQEQWIAEHRQAIQARFCMGVGGSFDVVSGRVKRAPRLFQRTGTEFLYRLLAGPWRWKRQVVLPLFLGMTLRRAFFGKAAGQVDSSSGGKEEVSNA